MNLPIIIQYSDRNLNNIKDPQALLDQLSGKQECSFLYYAPQENRFRNPRVRVDILGKHYSIIAEFSLDFLCLRNPWFVKTDTLRNEYSTEGDISLDCSIDFIKDRLAAINYIIEKGYYTQLPDIKNHLEKCSKLQKPVVPVHTDEEKKIWTAYCEGLNALNKEKKQLLAISYVYKPRLFHDNRKGDIYTLKIDLDRLLVKRLPEEIKELLKNKYEVKDVRLSKDSTELCVIFSGLEKVLSDDIERLNELTSEYGFKLAVNGVTNTLKASVVYKSFEDRNDLKNQLEKRLTKELIRFTKEADYTYVMETDQDSELFCEIVRELYADTAEGKVYTKILMPLQLDDSVMQDVQNAIIGNNRIALSDEGVLFKPIDKADYEILKSLVQEPLNRNHIPHEYPLYFTVCKIVSTNEATKLRMARMSYAETQLMEFKNIAHSFNISEEAYSMRFEFGFETGAQRDIIYDQLTAAVKELGDGFRLIIKERTGYTSIRYEQNSQSMMIADEEVNQKYKDEDIVLVNSQEYNRKFGNVENSDVMSPSQKEQYDLFLSSCPVIGTCHQRTKDYIIIQLSEEFYNGEHMKQRVSQRDMVFFPSVGSSVELKRQSEAIQRINFANAQVGPKRIQPPVNPRLCDYLFNPLYARDITENVSEMMKKIRENQLEPRLNDKQLEAVAKAVLAKDLMLIQGPPGTGKTTVIAEIIWQEIRRNPKCRILLTSQTNLAVDNALERLKYNRAIRPVRVISEQRESQDDFLYNIKQLDNWAISKESDKENVVEQWINEISSRIDPNGPLYEYVEDWRNALDKKELSVRKMFVDAYKSNVNLIASTCSLCGSQLLSQMYSQMYDNADNIYFDVVIMDEASKATPLEMAVPMVLGEKVIVIGDHRQLPPLMDENTIDTALRKAGYDNLAEKIIELKESQFKKLFLMSERFRPNLVATLNTQYRMHQSIMQTINQFYVDELGENGLICGIKDIQDSPHYDVPGSRWHGISCEPFIFQDTHVVWVNVEGKEEKENLSFKNMAEIQAIKTVMNVLTNAPGFSEYMNAQTSTENKEIGIITFYSAQKKEIKKLEREGELNSLYDYRIDVVDRFQGMERNIIIVSTVRSNNYNGIGFAKDVERINVAFSRARSLLIIIGNRDLFYTKSTYRKAIDQMETVDIKQISHILING